MKKNILLVAGIAGMLLGSPLSDALAKPREHVAVEVSVGQNKGHHHHKRHMHKRSPRRVVARHRHHDMNVRQHDSRDGRGM